MQKRIDEIQSEYREWCHLLPQLEEEEKDMINQLAELLTVPEKTAISIIEVMLIKNKV